jgi:hypothetical protein
MKLFPLKTLKKKKISIKKGRLGFIPVLELAVVTSSSGGLDGTGEISSSSEEREQSSSVASWKAATGSLDPATADDGRTPYGQGKAEDSGAELSRRYKRDGL